MPSRPPTVEKNPTPVYVTLHGRFLVSLGGLLLDFITFAVVVEARGLLVDYCTFPLMAPIASPNGPDV